MEKQLLEEKLQAFQIFGDVVLLTIEITKLTCLEYFKIT